MVQPPSYCTTQPERQRHPRRPHAQGDLPIAEEVSQIHLQPDEEQEQDEPEVRDEVEVRDRGGGEDGVGESGYASHDGGSEHNASDDFGDDARLADFRERVVEEAAEEDDDAGLDYEHYDGVLGGMLAVGFLIRCVGLHCYLGVIMGGVSTFEDAALGRCSEGARCRAGGDRDGVVDHLGHCGGYTCHGSGVYPLGLS